ncbi:kinase-like domain-containing protein [Mycena sp. CBHHK59/15]|nr:kinase-like domain-containing protein [Mycena sp. CBHHK59/15]
MSLIASKSSREASPTGDEEDEEEEEDEEDEDDDDEEEEAYFWHDQIIAELRRACRDDDPRNAYAVIETLSVDRLGNHSYTAKAARTGEVVVIKVTELAPPVEKFVGQRMITELFLMRDMLPHLNVVNFFDLYLFETTEVWLVTEYMAGGVTLGEIVANNSNAFTEEQIARICLETCKGLAHLHSQLIIHRDIRSASVVIDANGRVKITGFGFSVQLPDRKAKRRTMVSTLNLPNRSPYTVDKTYWTAPEVIKRKEYGPEVDVWAFGITVIEMIDRAPPYAGEEPLKVLFLILVNGTPELKQPDTLSEELKDFLGNCLDVDVASRASMSELVEHGFLTKACPSSGLASLFDWKSGASSDTVDSVAPETVGPTAPDSVAPPVPQALDSVASELVGSTASDTIDSPAPETLDSTAADTVDPPAPETLDSAAPDTVDPPAPETLDSAAPETLDSVSSETVDSPAPVMLDSAPNNVDSPAPVTLDPAAPDMVDSCAPEMGDSI